MLILEDTRQQEKKHELKHKYFIEQGIQWNRTSLYCGDYTLPSDQSVCIDTKKDIQELIGDINVKKLSKEKIQEEIMSLAHEYDLDLQMINQLFHAITDDDTDRFAEKDINDICFKNNIPESCIAELQKLYVKRHGFFHRGLKRAQNSEVKLYVLVENNDGVTNVRDVFSWVNPRLRVFINSSAQDGWYKNGKPKYKKVQKYPRATKGE